jgi:DNA-binding transcriptional LysR family regulator
VPLTNLPDLNARDLAAVLALAEYKSFIAASALLKVSQPTLSRTVKHVEQVTGVTLFARTSRRVEITPAGREFVAVAERILNDLQLALRNMGEVASEQRGQVIMSTFPIFAHQVLPEIIRVYRQTRQHVEIHVRQGRFPEVLEDVYSGVSDFGITYVDAVPDTIESVTLRQEKMFVVLPVGHRLASRRGGMALTELEQEPFISLGRETHTRRMLDGAAATAGAALRHAVIVPGFLDIISLVRADVGIGILPSGVLPFGDRTIVAVPLKKPELSVSVRLLTLRSRQLTPAASSFIRLTLDRMAADERRKEA